MSHEIKYQQIYVLMNEHVYLMILESMNLVAFKNIL